MDCGTFNVCSSEWMVYGGVISGSEIAWPPFPASQPLLKLGCGEKWEAGREGKESEQMSECVNE